MRDVASGKSKSILLLKPNFSAPSTRRSGPSWTPTWPNTVFEETSVARARLMVPYSLLSTLETLALPISITPGDWYSVSSVVTPSCRAVERVTILNVEPGA